jgi:hypothetical protein
LVAPDSALGRRKRAVAKHLFPLDMKSLCRLALAFTLGAASASAHIGSPDVYFEGDAGPYQLFVTVRLPLVIPGIAEIDVRSTANDLREVRIVPLRLTGPGSQYPPAPDLAKLSKDDPRLFTGSLWLMEGGSLQVRIDVHGARGQGRLSVPVPSIAQRVLPMRKGLGVLLLLLMLILAFGAISIAAAAVREGELDPGAAAGALERQRARRVMTVTAALVAGAICVGARWWGSEAAFYASTVYQPPRLVARLEAGDRLVLHAEPRTAAITIPAVRVSGFRPRGYRFDDLIPDHGHLAHLFMIRMPALDRFLHLHPEQIEAGRFAQQLPTIAAGHYKLLADVVHRTGFPETMIGEIDLGNTAGAPLSGDDCGWSGPPLIEGPEGNTAALLPDGGRVIWVRDQPLKANVPMSFRFRVENSRGKPVQDLEPYMGMAGHAEFVRSDLTVFAHVHPAGSVSMAALELAQSSLLPLNQPGLVPGTAGGNGADTGRKMGMNMPMLSSRLAPEISFPYGFPKPGRYRIFVQIKRSGRIETAVFDARVLY